jgi:hypothetical protein
VNQVGINRGGFLKTLIGDVPYLNGGLFDEDEDDKSEKVEIPDAAIRTVLIDLFSHFNFTLKSTKGIKWMRAPEQVGFLNGRPQPTR